MAALVGAAEEGEAVVRGLIPRACATVALKIVLLMEAPFPATLRPEQELSRTFKNLGSGVLGLDGVLEFRVFGGIRVHDFREYRIYYPIGHLFHRFWFGENSCGVLISLLQDDYVTFVTVPLHTFSSVDASARLSPEACRAV